MDNKLLIVAPSYPVHGLGGFAPRTVEFFASIAGSQCGIVDINTGSGSVPGYFPHCTGLAANSPSEVGIEILQHFKGAEVIMFTGESEGFPYERTAALTNAAQVVISEQQRDLLAILPFDLNDPQSVSVVQPATAALRSAGFEVCPVFREEGDDVAVYPLGMSNACYKSYPLGKGLAQFLAGYRGTLSSLLHNPPKGYELAVECIRFWLSTAAKQYPFSELGVTGEQFGVLPFSALDEPSDLSSRDITKILTIYPCYSNDIPSDPRNETIGALFPVFAERMSQ